jgi:dihydroorotate dehydrogenase
VVTRGLDVFRDVTTGLSRFLELRGSSSINDIVGIASRHDPSHAS